MWRSFRKSIVCLMVFSMLIGIIGPSQVRANGRDFNCMSKETILGNGNGFLLSNSSEAATIYIDTSREEISWSGNYEYCGLEIIAETFADDVDLVTNNRPNVVTNEQQLSGNVIIAGTIGNNSIIDSLVQNGIMNVNNLYENGELKWDSYQMQFVSAADLQRCGIQNVSSALVIAGSNKRGAMYGMFHISERIGVSAWVYMADAIPVQYQAVYLDSKLLEFNQGSAYISKEPSVKYRGFFINDEAPSFTGWAYNRFGGLNENLYENIFELLIRMKANYLWPAMWGNSFSDEGKKFKLANAVLADAYGICMGTSHHEACHRAGVEWQKIYRNYGTSNEWDYGKNGDAIYKFWQAGIERNGNFENTITMGMRGEGDSALKGDVQYNIDILKEIISDQTEIVSNYCEENPGSKTKDALKIYIPYSENEEFYYGPDDGSVDGLNVWEGMDDITIMMTDDNYGNIRSLPEESVRDREAGWGLYYHLDGHVGTGAYEWVSSTQLEHIWDQLTMAYEYNVRNIWVINVGDIKPLEMELNYCMDLAYDIDKWGQMNTAKTYREEWLQSQLGGVENCPDDVAEGVAECVANFLKISTYRKPEYVSSSMYSVTEYNEIQEVLELCFETVRLANYYYDNYFKGTMWDDAYYQIVYYQAVGTANVTQMQIYKGLNDYFIKQGSSLANIYADLVDESIAYDEELTYYYNNDMSGKKWHKMMSSPHVGFVSWDSSGWSYPKSQRIELQDTGKMIVSVDGGSEELLFSNTQKQRHCITLSNGGDSDYDYTIASRADWIQITDKEGNQIINGGTVKDASYVYISVDWGRVRSNKTGTVVIRGAGQEVKVVVKTEYTDYINKGIGTHIESNNVLSIDAKKYSFKKGSESGVSWACIDGYGRYDSAMRMIPSTISFTERSGGTYEVTSGKTTRTVTEYHEPTAAPYMEYKIYVDEDGEYTFTAYTTPTNNIYKPMGWGYVPVELFYGLQIDDEYIDQINSLPDGKYISFAADGDNNWRSGIRDNIHISKSTGYLSEGVHTIRFYGMHAGLALERLVISNEDLKSSYLGPQATFMLDYDIIPEQKKGVHYEAAAGTMSFGVLSESEIASITSEGDINDAADEYKEEVAIPRPYVPTPTPIPSPTQGSNVQTAVATASAIPTPTVKWKTNKVYTVGKLKYKIVKLSAKGGNVQVVGTKSKNIKRSVVPAKVKISGRVFEVKSIGNSVWKNCKKLESIVLKGKTNLQIKKKSFSGIPNKIKVYISKKNYKKYKSRTSKKIKFVVS